MSHLSNAEELIAQARELADKARLEVVEALKAGETSLEDLWKADLSFGRADLTVDPWASEGYVAGVEYNYETGELTLKDGFEYSPNMLDWYTSGDGPSC